MAKKDSTASTESAVSQPLGDLLSECEGKVERAKALCDLLHLQAQQDTSDDIDAQTRNFATLTAFDVLDEALDGLSKLSVMVRNLEASHD